MPIMDKPRMADLFRAEEAKRYNYYANVAKIIAQQKQVSYNREQAAYHEQGGGVFGGRRLSNRQKFAPTKSKEYVLKQGMAQTNCIILQETNIREETKPNSRLQTLPQSPEGFKINLSAVQAQPPIVNPGPLQVVERNEKPPTPGPGYYKDDQFSLQSTLKKP